MAESEVIKVGVDSSGRPIFMSRYMQRVWGQILVDPAVAPFAGEVEVTQGAWMSRVPGGGAVASAGYHDFGGCVDIRTWNLQGFELEAFIRTTRRYGWAFWRRDQNHGGMDPHAHGVLGTDFGLSVGAKFQWSAYLNGRDGLASNGPDYEWRPSPLVLVPPEPEEIDMTPDELRQIIREEVARNQVKVPGKDGELVAINDDTAVRRILEKLDAILAAVKES